MDASFGLAGLAEPAPCAAPEGAGTLRRLTVLAYANGFTLWHYKADGEPFAFLERPRAFDMAADVIAKDDAVIVSGVAEGVVLGRFVTPFGLPLLRRIG